VHTFAGWPLGTDDRLNFKKSIRPETLRHAEGLIMSDESQPPPKSRPPSKSPQPEELIESANRLKSQALYVSATRLIQESRHSREANDRKLKEAENLRKLTPKRKPGSNLEK
jgi:hypothetical protein